MEFLIQNNPDQLNIDRDVLMGRAKISGRSTYNKCMRELDEFGYTGIRPRSVPLWGISET